MTFVETDHPATSDRKLSGLAALGALPSNLYLHAVDLSARPLAEALAATGVWNRDAVSVVVAEGVFMYLEESAVSAFLSGVRDVTAPASRLLFTYLRTDAAGHPWLGAWSPLMRAGLRLMGESLRWGAPEGNLDGFLGEHGIRSLVTAARCDLSRRYRPDAPIEGEPVEFMGIAETIAP